MVGVQGLLDQLHLEVDQLGRQLPGRLDRPGLVRVDADQRAGRFPANGVDTLQVVGAAHLDLERPEVACTTRPIGRPLHRVDADRVRGGRDRRRVESEHPPQGLAAQLAQQVVERPVDGALGRHLARQLADPAQHRLQRERILAQQLRRPLGERPAALRRLPVPLVRGAFPVADHVAVADRHLQHVLRLADAPRDHERLAHLERVDAAGQLHGRRAYPNGAQRRRGAHRRRDRLGAQRACSSGDRAHASGA